MLTCRRHLNVRIKRLKRGDLELSGPPNDEAEDAKTGKYHST